MAQAAAAQAAEAPDTNPAPTEHVVGLHASVPLHVTRGSACARGVDSGKFTQVRTRREEAAEGEGRRVAEDTEALTPKSTKPKPQTQP